MINRKNKRADQAGAEEGIFRRNKEYLRKTVNVCAICGKPINKDLQFPDPYSFSVDHILPISRGGHSTLDNLQAAHLICNRKKGDNLSSGKPIEHKYILPQYIDWAEIRAEE